MIHALAALLLCITPAERELAIADYQEHAAAGQRVRYVSLDAVPEDRHEQFVKALQFKLPHLSQSATLDRQKPQRLGETNLYRLDLDGLEWSDAAWQKAFRRAYTLSENPMIVRADVLLAWTYDTNRRTAYYDLLYAKQGKPPANINEFFAIWRVDLAKAVGRDRWHIIEHGVSGVAVGTRLVEWRQGPAAYAWFTKDSAVTVAQRDPLENLRSGPAFDAGEGIIAMPKLDTATGKVGTAQAYLLVDGKGNRVNKADSDVVSIRNPHPLVASTIITPGSCIACHTSGILPLPANALRNSLEAGVEVYDKKAADAAEIERRYLSVLDAEIKRNQDDFATFCELATGLPPAEAVANYVDSVLWYKQDVTQEQAAREVGCSVRDMQLAVAAFEEKYKLQYGGDAEFPQRLSRLAQGVPTPRDNWELETYFQVQLAVNEWLSKEAQK